MGHSLQPAGGRALRINKYQKQLCSNKSELRPHNIKTILGSIVKIIGGGDLYDHLMSKRILALIMNMIIEWATIFFEECGFGLDMGSLTISY